MTSIFLSTPSARRATYRLKCITKIFEYFYPRPPRGGRRPLTCAFDISSQFLSTPSARRATARQRAGGILLVISIHALREEGDHPLGNVFCGQNTFLSTPSARRATLLQVCSALRKKFLSTPSARRATGLPLKLLTLDFNFYPRPPRGGRRFSFCTNLGWIFISIHALREEGDSTPITSSIRCRISIHALREEGD